MADIDNMRGDTLRVVEENTLDNMRGVTQRVISENSIDNTRGVTYRVYNVNPALAPVIDELNVTPSTSAQTITAPEGTDGYSPVKVAAVTSAIDANITAGNIKKDVSILGVTGSYEGNVPTGTMYIISNGTYNVADKAIANVQVPTTAPTRYLEYSVDANGVIGNSTTTQNIINLSGVTTISNPYIFNKAYQNNTVISGVVNFSDVVTIGSSRNVCSEMFSGCTGITSVVLSSLTTISGLSCCEYMFRNCSGITSIDLSNLATVSGNTACNSMFSGCTGITSVILSSLTNLTGASCLTAMFDHCTNLTSLSFPALTSTSFGSLTNQFNNILLGVTGCTLHFPSNTQAKIETLTGYPNFGGTNTTVLFDLPATE